MDIDMHIVYNIITRDLPPLLGRLLAVIKAGENKDG